MELVLSLSSVLYMTTPPDESKCIRREPNYSLLLPILYAPVFPILRIALKNNPKLPVAYGAALAAALAHAGYVMFTDSSV